MRNPPVPYKHAGANDVSYSKSADSSLLAKKRQNFADGGAVNQSTEALKQLIADKKLDAPFNDMVAQRSSSSGGGGFQGGRGGDYGSNVYADDGSQWESQVPRYDKDGMPLRRTLRTPYGNVPVKQYAKGGIVKGAKK
jgi:hypothetical protein